MRYERCRGGGVSEIDPFVCLFVGGCDVIGYNSGKGDEINENGCNANGGISDNDIYYRNGMGNIALMRGVYSQKNAFIV